MFEYFYTEKSASFHWNVYSEQLGQVVQSGDLQKSNFHIFTGCFRLEYTLNDIESIKIGCRGGDRFESITEDVLFFRIESGHLHFMNSLKDCSIPELNSHIITFIPKSTKECKMTFIDEQSNILLEASTLHISSFIIPKDTLAFYGYTFDCSIPFEIALISFPNFFTPNGDGNNDFWQIKGIDKSYYKTGTISIFNRYGKQITTFSIDDIGWDGTYNGKQMIGNDYWFQAILIDQKDQMKKRTGNFSLVRN
jgi:gliding motility-associated-like protein